jgi:YVTN family beta-propeller protein
MGKKWNRVLHLSILILFGMCSDMDASPFAYISNSGDNSVSVIDTKTNSVAATVSVGTKPYGVAVHPEGTVAYIANFGSSTVSVIDAALNAVVATVPVGTNPFGIAVDPAGTFAYVANYSDNTVSVIDLTENAVTATIRVGANPIGVAVNPDGSYVYAANYTGNTVSVISTISNTITATIAVGANPTGITVNPSGSYAYVANSGSNSVSVINTTSNTVTATITGTGISTPWGVAVNPSGTYGYVSSFSGSQVSVFDTASNAVTNSISVGSHPIGLTVHIAGTYTYVANYSDGTVSVIDNATNAVVTEISVGSRPYALGVFTAPYGSAPTVTTTSPVSDAIDVSTSATIKATFSDTMNPATLTSSTFLLSGGITGTVTYNSANKTATFTPSATLSEYTSYTATLTTGIMNSSGTSLASNYSWNFKTSVGSGCFIATTVYGSYDDVHVRMLRKFRDRHLLPHALGAAMVRMYYQYSPPVANFMRLHPFLKRPARWLLTPIVFFIQYPLCLLFITILGLITILGEAMKRFKKSTAKDPLVSSPYRRKVAMCPPDRMPPRSP